MLRLVAQATEHKPHETARRRTGEPHPNPGPCTGPHTINKYHHFAPSKMAAGSEGFSTGEKWVE